VDHGMTLAESKTIFDKQAMKLAGQTNMKENK
jgi:hypothetical protein